MNLSNHENMNMKFPLYAKLVTILFGVVLVVFVMKMAKSVLVPLLVSGLLAVLITPLSGWFEKRHFPKALAGVLSVILLLAALFGLGYIMSNQVINLTAEFGIIEYRIREIIENINRFIEQHVEGVIPVPVGNIQQSIFEYFSANIANITQGAIATITSLTMLIIFPVYIFLFLYYRHFLFRFVLMVFAEKHRETVKQVAGQVREIVQNYIVGMSIVIVILAVLYSIVLYSLGIRHALFFAIFAAMLNVIPYVGPFIGATLPITFALFTKESLLYPLGIFAAFYVIQNIEGNFFTPKIVGKKVSMNPFMTIVALFVGNFIWGLAGMILFIPGMAILKVIFDVIPGMEPYGFLLGANRKSNNAPIHKISIKERISQLRLRLKEFRKTKKSNQAD